MLPRQFDLGSATFGFDGLAAVADVSTDAIAGWSDATVTPAVERVDGYGEHHREIGNDHQLLLIGGLHSRSFGPVEVSASAQDLVVAPASVV